MTSIRTRSPSGTSSPNPTRHTRRWTSPSRTTRRSRSTPPRTHAEPEPEPDPELETTAEATLAILDGLDRLAPAHRPGERRAARRRRVRADPRDRPRRLHREPRRQGRARRRCRDPERRHHAALWGCGIAANGERAWTLGRFDVVTRPIDPESAGRQLAALASPGANVIMVGCESATQIPLRQGLSQAGLSVRTAWDRNQAGDLADTVQPAIAIVDLGSETAGGFELIVDLMNRPQPPLIVVVPGSDAQNQAFETAIARHAACAAPSQRDEVIAQATGSVGR
jgi:CheY-like chemotaxis protein